MRLEFAYKQLTDGKTHKHFLLTDASLALTATLAGGASVAVPVQRNAGGIPAFTADLTPQLIPAKLDSLQMTYKVERTFDGKSFTLLQIKQVFIASAVDPNAVATATYALTPGSWEDAVQRKRVSNSAIHPLIEFSLTTPGKITLKVAMLDLSDAWAHLHRENDRYKRHALRSAGTGLAFKVFAYVGGAPLIWYCIVPNHLAAVPEVSAHVFFSPADNAIEQDDEDEKYLGRSSSGFKTDGLALLKYITPPIPDTDVEKLKPQIELADTFRNVVGFEFVRDKGGNTTSTITPLHWAIGAGFQRGFMHIGGGKPAQFLLLPQRRGSHGWAITDQLKSATNSVTDVLQTNTTLLSPPSDVLIGKGAMVLSCYSESGVDLWYASKANQSNVKAIVAIEPQNLNVLENDYRKKRDAEGKVYVDTSMPPAPLGKDVIPLLLNKNVKVFIIGRHGPAQKYRPQIAEIAKLRLLPQDPAAIFAYPPNPDANDFVKYRVQRMVDPGSDPLMRSEEWVVMLKLASKGISGGDALKAILRPISNVDDNTDPNVSQWYSHHFALTGGDEMKLDPSGLYGKPVTYRTFFQVAVHEIG